MLEEGYEICIRVKELSIFWSEILNMLGFGSEYVIEWINLEKIIFIEEGIFL